MNTNRVCMCFILCHALCIVATARAVLLSALACITKDWPISFMMVCVKINSGGSAPWYTVLILRWTRQQFPVLYTRV